MDSKISPGTEPTVVYRCQTYPQAHNTSCQQDMRSLVMCRSTDYFRKRFKLKKCRLKYHDLKYINIYTNKYNKYQTRP